MYVTVDEFRNVDVTRLWRSVKLKEPINLIL